MKKIQDYSLIAVFVTTAILVAVVGLRAYSGYMRNKAEEEALFQQRKEEILARNAEAQNRVQEMQVEIIEMQNDVEALQAFIDDTVNAANEVQIRKAEGNTENGEASSADSVSEGSSPGQSDTLSGNDVSGQPGSISGNDGAGQSGSVSGNEETGQSGSVSGNNGTGFSGSVSGNEGDFEGSISGNDGWSVSGNTVSGNGEVTVSGNDDFGFLMGSVSENDGDVNYYTGDMTSDDIFDEWRPIYEQPDMTLEERKQWRTSYQETLEVNQADREWIAENQYDFSQMKIACLGDSITKAANLEGEENYEQYAYPARLQELLGAEEVYNLGIGGSSIGRYWADAFVDRYTEIPQDSDIIIVMGGTNDGFCVSEEEFGSLDERAYHTFCGDLNELMSGLRENYPDAQIFFATPLPNVLQDYLMSEREYLLPQKDFVEVIQTLADEYDFELIDLYNSNVLDSHDANIIKEYMPDGVHGNPAGYQILAERFAGELVKYYNEDDSESDQENAPADGSVLGNAAIGTGTGGNAGTSATAGVGGNTGAGTGVITIVGGNTGIGGNGTESGTDTENSSGSEEDGTDVGNGAEGEEDGTDVGNGAEGEEDGTGIGNGAGSEEGGAGIGSGAGSEEGGTGIGSGAEGEEGGTDVEGGSEEDETGIGSGAGTESGGRNAGFDTGTGTGEKNDSGSERKQYRYEY